MLPVIPDENNDNFEWSNPSAPLLACLAVYRHRASHRGLPPVFDEDPERVVQALDLGA
jgi:hypothetical protein